MSWTSTYSRFRFGSWFISALTAAGLGIMLHYILTSYYLDDHYSSDGWGQRNGSPFYWPNRGWIQTHWLTGICVMLLVMAQFYQPLRKNYSTIHRWMGRSTIILLFISMFGLSYFAFYVPSPLGSTDASNRIQETGLWFLLLPTLISSYMTWYRAYQKDYQAHRRWAIRIAILLSAAPMLRILMYHIYPDYTLADPGTIATTYWLCWVPSLMVCEAYLQWEQSDSYPFHSKPIQKNEYHHTVDDYTPIQDNHDNYGTLQTL